MNRVINSAVLVFGLTAAILHATTTYAQQNDRAAFGLKGQVKKVTVVSGTVTETPVNGFSNVDFDRDGRLTHVNGQPIENNDTYDIKRDTSGRITDVTFKKATTPYVAHMVYNREGHIAQVSLTQLNSKSVYRMFSFVYNAFGFVSHCEKTLEKQKKYTINYEYSGIDHHGNWLKRKGRLSNGETDDAEWQLTYWDNPVKSKTDTIQVPPVPERRPNEKPDFVGKQEQVIHKNSDGQANKKNTMSNNDLCKFGLKGQVKSIQCMESIGYLLPTALYEISDYNNPTGGAIFGTNGNLVAESENGDNFKVTRNSSGQVIKIAVTSTEYDYDVGDEVPIAYEKLYTYNANGSCKQIVGQTIKNGNLSDKTVYSLIYSPKGLITQCNKKHTEYIGKITMSKSYTQKYIYNQFDSHGNWTERTGSSSDGGTWTDTRIITYRE